MACPYVKGLGLPIDWELSISKEFLSFNERSLIENCSFELSFTSDENVVLTTAVYLPQPPGTAVIYLENSPFNERSFIKGGTVNLEVFLQERTLGSPWGFAGPVMN